MDATKPGYKTTEFWLALIAMVLGSLTASGLVPTTGVAAQVVGLLTTLFTALGYTAVRGVIKTTTLKTDAIVEASAAQSPQKPA